MSIQLPEPIARALAKFPLELAHELADVITKAAASPDPKAALARAAQVLAHEHAADAAVDALFKARGRVANTGE